MNYRVEKDALGEKNVPVEAYWGIHTCPEMAALIEYE